MDHIRREEVCTVVYIQTRLFAIDSAFQRWSLQRLCSDLVTSKCMPPLSSLMWKSAERHMIDLLGYSFYIFLLPVFEGDGLPLHTCHFRLAKVQMIKSKFNVLREQASTHENIKHFQFVKYPTWLPVLYM